MGVILGVCAFEMLLALALMWPVYRTPATATAIAYMVSVTLWLAQLKARDPALGCSCFGAFASAGATLSGHQLERSMLKLVAALTRNFLIVSVLVYVLPFRLSAADAVLVGASVFLLYIVPVSSRIIEIRTCISADTNCREAGFALAMRPLVSVEWYRGRVPRAIPDDELLPPGAQRLLQFYG